MPLRLLHISDIHFHVPIPGWNETEDLENELIRDVQRLASIGTFDAILIGGDIAFRATTEEYEFASAWIERLMDAAGGLVHGQVRMVPGNHDVSWAAIDDSAYARQFREQLAEAAPDAIDWILHERVAADPAGAALMLPLAEYVKFAESFGCPTSAEKLAWEDDSLVVDGWPVRLVGINSAINSGSDDEKGVLVVGRNQCRIPRDSTTIRILMLHHPPAWLKDWVQIEGHVRRAHLVLFGHEHALDARQETSGGTVEVSAGAMSPELDEGGVVAPYIPTYNMIELSRTEGDRLKVVISARSWQPLRTIFDAHGAPIEYEVDLSPAIREGEATIVEQPGEEVVMSDAAPLLEPGGTAEPVDDNEAARRRALRNAGVRFLQLQPFKRLELAQRLGMLLEEDADVPPSELGGNILERVRIANLTERLIEEMNR